MASNLPKDMTEEKAHELFRYDPTTGLIYWRVGNFEGRAAGSIHKGYRRVWHKRRFYPVHRIVWLLKKGPPVPRVLDHINQDKLDNRIENLRKSDHSRNTHNSGVTSANTSGFRGVHWSSQKKKWRGVIVVRGKPKHLGYFDCPQEASKAIEAVRDSLFSNY